MSVSYALPLVVAAVAPPGARAFGVDVELDSPTRRRAVLEAIGTNELTAWTRLEAAAKARGTGLRGRGLEHVGAGIIGARGADPCAIECDLILHDAVIRLPAAGSSAATAAGTGAGTGATTAAGTAALTAAKTAARTAATTAVVSVAVLPPRS